MNAADDPILDSNLIVTSTSEPDFSSGTEPLRPQDLFSSPEVQGFEWIDKPMDKEMISEIVEILTPALRERGVEYTIVRDYDCYDFFDPNALNEILRHAHVIVPVLRDIKPVLSDFKAHESQWLGTAGGVYLGYKLSKHGDKRKARALSRMQQALGDRIDEAKRVAIKLLTDSYPNELTNLVYNAYDLDDKGLLFSFHQLNGRIPSTSIVVPR